MYFARTFAVEETVGVEMSGRWLGNCVGVSGWCVGWEGGIAYASGSG